MFDSILIANRGEIACRIIRTARRLGIHTVAVYSDADARAQHVGMADEAHRIGPAPAAESYLDTEAILAVAAKACVQAIHPGYGFLSENATFAEACAAAGVTFVGPSARAIRLMGSKLESKRLLEREDVPLIPGYHGADQSDPALNREAERVGFPLLVKASAGGGGKGMRVVREAAGLAEAIQGARREAIASFGDGDLLLERFVSPSRHVEIQVFADQQGDAVHLFERDCSLQRRHQKVIEEAPAPGVAPEVRAAMGAAAVRIAKALDYEGAGTVEFLLGPDGSFYFIEMNTRLQVEHPVTEMVTGQDLVEWQLRVASGEPLPARQDELRVSGHSFEARLYAEDPAQSFLPSIGRLRVLQLPEEGTHVRVDTGVRQGDEISMHYDPMIAKVIVWDHDRDAALRQLRQALRQVIVSGVVTNASFLGGMARHPSFQVGAVDTSFLDRRRHELLPESEPASRDLLSLAALGVVLEWQHKAARSAARSGDPFSPWHSATGWRLNAEGHHDLDLVDGENASPVRVRFGAERDQFTLDLPSETVAARGHWDGQGHLDAVLDGARVAGTYLRQGREIVVQTPSAVHRLTLNDPLEQAGLQESAHASLAAPMPGRVVATLVEDGADVERGQPLMVLEAMKMEHTVRAPAAGRVEKLHYREGDQVDEGVDLLAFQPGGSAGTQEGAG